MAIPLTPGPKPKPQSSFIPNIIAYLVLARMELAAGHLASSASEVSHALHLEANDSAALGMKQALQARGQTLP